MCFPSQPALEVCKNTGLTALGKAGASVGRSLVHQHGTSPVLGSRELLLQDDHGLSRNKAFPSSSSRIRALHSSFRGQRANHCWSTGPYHAATAPRWVLQTYQEGQGLSWGLGAASATGDGNVSAGKSLFFSLAKVCLTAPPAHRAPKFYPCLVNSFCIPRAEPLEGWIFLTFVPGNN